MPDPQRQNLSPMRLLIAALLFPAPAIAADLSPADLVTALQGGGLVVYIRHGQTEADYADQVTADPSNCATQRVLSRTGWQQAKDIGQGFKRLQIPVSDVLSSQYCRAWQTADLAFGTTEETVALNFEPSEEYTPVQVARMRANVLPLLQAPDPQSNRVIVGHDDPFEAVTGIYPEPQGVAYVLRIMDGKVDVLGALAPDIWPSL